MDSIDKLLDFYNKSDEQDMYHNVVEHVLKNIHKVEEVTIYDMADLCFSSTATISRLVKKLDFKNYTDFKTQISYALKNYKYLNKNTREIELFEDSDIIPLYFNFLLNNIAALKEEIEYSHIAEISKKFHEAEEVFFYSYPKVQTNILQKALIVSGKKAYDYDNFVAQEKSLKKVKEKMLVFAVIPNLIEMTSMHSIIRRAKEKGAVVITICSQKKNDYKRYSDIQISFDGTKTSMDLYLFMILINLIKYDYTYHYVDSLIEKLYN